MRIINLTLRTKLWAEIGRGLGRRQVFVHFFGEGNMIPRGNLAQRGGGAGLAGFSSVFTIQNRFVVSLNSSAFARQKRKIERPRNKTQAFFESFLRFSYRAHCLSFPAFCRPLGESRTAFRSSSIFFRSFLIFSWGLFSTGLTAGFWPNSARPLFQRLFPSKAQKKASSICWLPCFQANNGRAGHKIIPKRVVLLGRMQRERNPTKATKPGGAKSLLISLRLEVVVFELE